MTAEREAMTERRAFEEWARSTLVMDLTREEGNPSVYESGWTQGAWNGWQAAIANLSRAAVAWEYYYRVDECNAESAHDPNCICWHLEGGGPFKDAKHDESSPILGWRRTTHPPEPARDAQGAARYRWLRDRMYRFEIEAGVLDSKAFAQRPRIGYGREIDSAIDNAMTKENGND